MTPRFSPAARRAAVILPLLALALRCWDVGNPVIHVDEQWYLLVGDRLLHGAVPFVDLWDRKPVGLFLLFAGIRVLGGADAEGGIVAYQLVACAFAAATAVVVAAAARAVGARERGALAAGAAYLLGLTLLGGRGGQAPVFYDLPVALAGLLALGLPALAAAERRGAIVASGLAACALGGVAIQLKYTAAVEAAFAGLAHLWFLRRAGARWPATAGAGATWLLLGLAPTVAAGAWYGAHGWWAAWRFANFTSIALRPGYPPDQLAMRLLGIGAQLAPLGVAAALGWRQRTARALRVAFGWLAAALLGFAAIGTWFDHYALPLLAPLAVCAAPALGRSMRLLVAALGLMAAVAGAERVAAHDDGTGARAVAALVARESGGHCPYVFMGDTITYLLAHACTPTPYAFPNLLAYTTEQGATGIDEAAEVRRVLATRPPVIVTVDRRLAIWNRDSLAALKAALRRDYRLRLSVPRAGWHTLVFVRQDLGPRLRRGQAASSVGAMPRRPGACESCGGSPPAASAPQPLHLVL
ncbi:hypothetical protein [uncultured Sphingomonas sp.]|uniref:hypothetical protein n=1 Tax=uncultured Sphingomonas sp. TaxID=158754 RepID=UPI0035C9C9EF